MQIARLASITRCLPGLRRARPITFYMSWVFGIALLADQRSDLTRSALKRPEPSFFATPPPDGFTGTPELFPGFTIA